MGFLAGMKFINEMADTTVYAISTNGLYQHFSSFRSDILSFDAVAILHKLPLILPLVEESVPIDKLSPTAIQLGTCIIQTALAHMWINLSIKPQYAAGHSLGEYAALHIAGILNISDTIYLYGHRASLLENACTPGTHGMIAVKGSSYNLAGIIDRTLAQITYINRPDDTVLSGPNTNINTIYRRLSRLEYRFTKLPIPFAFHSSQVEPGLDNIKAMAYKVHFQPPVLPFISTLLGDVVTSGGIVRPQYIRHHCRETVNFFGAFQTAEQQGLMHIADICIEISTHPLLTRMIKSNFGPSLHCCPSLRRGEECSRPSQSLSELSIWLA